MTERGEAEIGDSSDLLQNPSQLLQSHNLMPPKSAWLHLSRLAFDSGHSVVGDGEFLQGLEQKRTSL